MNGMCNVSICNRYPNTDLAVVEMSNGFLRSQMLPHNNRPQKTTNLKKSSLHPPSPATVATNNQQAHIVFWCCGFIVFAHDLLLLYLELFPKTAMRVLRGRRIIFFFQWIVVSFVVVYVVLLLQVHNLTIRQYADANHPMSWLHSSSNSHKNNKVIAGILPKLLRSNKTTTPAVSNYSIRSDLQNGILEGHVQEYITSGKDLWEHSSVIPQWMKDYFKWHKERRALLQNNPDQWDQLKYYLLECTNDYGHCGGTADRLGPLPFHVRIASATNRLLLIHWTKPAPLEDFLLPPIGGIDWRVPGWLLAHLQQESATRRGTVEATIIKFSAYEQARLLRVKFQSHNHGQETYDVRRTSEDDPSFAQIYHDLWRVFFTPVPPIAALIEQQMNELQLIPGTYISVHLRALYAVKEQDDALLEWWSRNSIHCATTKLPIYHPSSTYASDNPMAMPILFVSDSTFATQTAKSYAHERGIDVVHRTHLKPPLHLEKAANRSSLSARDFYDTFVDLYMIGMSQCTAYNMGGFGRWGNLIGYNSTCVFQMKANMIQCDFTSQGRAVVETGKENPQATSETPLFLPPTAD